ncbi:MAG: hypothetical protein ACREQZ_12665, partial [Woeseiaceae bacterium]
MDEEVLESTDSNRVVESNQTDTLVERVPHDPHGFLQPTLLRNAIVAQEGHVFATARSHSVVRDLRATKRYLSLVSRDYDFVIRIVLCIGFNRVTTSPQAVLAKP